MASIVTTTAVASGFRFNKSPTGNISARKGRRVVLVRAEGQGINPEIRKNEEKVVDSVVISELSKPLTPYCRCWRSGTFPLCDGSHVKHNKATGDNVGPLLLKKQFTSKRSSQKSECRKLRVLKFRLLDYHRLLVSRQINLHL